MPQHEIASGKSLTVAWEGRGVSCPTYFRNFSEACRNKKCAEFRNCRREQRKQCAESYSRNSTPPKTNMNIRLALLLTHDANFENIVTEALKDSGAQVLVRHDVDHALEIGCSRAAQFDLAIIDRHDCHAITLLSALRACRHDLPVVIVTSGDTPHCAALAYANGATACLAKPIDATDLKLFLRQLLEPELKLAEI
jgi:CheY-like chemotaxis protein